MDGVSECNSVRHRAVVMVYLSVTLFDTGL